VSILKSSDDHLTLNADGSSKNILFQADGVQKASISSAGLFTSTTIDATVLTGNLPAISGASLTGVGGDLSFGGDTFGADKTIGSNDNYALSFETNGTTRLQITNGGLGRSQFIAKGWINMNGTGTISITDSHNVSSITDTSTGRYTVTWDVDNANGENMVLAGCNPDNNAGAYGGCGTHLAGSAALDFRKASNDTVHDVNDVMAICYGD
tara:strand:- start:253 stop:882 length:630 start_codon:yes stop_codon:yes gene_type:complete